MKIQVIKYLCENYTIDEISSAEEAIVQGIRTSITIDGESEGERLTHCLAAKWCLEAMQKSNISLSEAIRAFGVKVRTSIDLS